MSNVIYFLTAAASNPNSLLTAVLLPFLLIFVILWGILNVMKIFGPEGRKINFIIALVITIFTAFTDAWGVVATQLAAFTGVFVYVMFFAVFILGTIFWAIGRSRNVYGEHVSGTGGTNLNSLKVLDKEIGKRMKKYKELKDQGRDKEAESLGETIIMLKKRREIMILGMENR